MKLEFKIEKNIETEKSGMFKKDTIHMYILTASFQPAENEKAIFKEHPLFKDLVFMEYNEVDRWVTGLIFKDKHQKDRIKRISMSQIFDKSNYKFRAYSIKRITELRALVVSAVKDFVEIVDIVEKLEGNEEIDITMETLVEMKKLEKQ